MASVTVDNAPCEIPRINLSKLSPATPADDPDWVSARSEVMLALETNSCIEIVTDKITPELWEAVFSKAVTEAFAVPMETKMRCTKPDSPFMGNYVNYPSFNYESILISSSNDRGNVEQLATLMLGESENSTRFCETMFAFSTRLKEVEEMVRRMVFEAYGVSKNWESYNESLDPGLRISHYGAPNTEEAVVILSAHTDNSVTSLVCQHELEGLQVLANCGTSWIMPTRNSITFLVGDLLSAWSNGRLKAAAHRVMSSGINLDRYSAIYSSVPKEGVLTEAAKELVDDEHPLLYRPFYNKDYMQFKLSPGGKVVDTLQAFCGVAATSNELET